MKMHIIEIEDSLLETLQKPRIMEIRVEVIELLVSLSV
jgi:hypothetical protein